MLSYIKSLLPARKKRPLTLSRATVLAKGQLPAATAYTDATQTFSAVNTFSSPVQYGSSSTPTVNGQIGYNGTNLLFREGGTNKTIGSGSSFTGDLNAVSLGYLTDTSGELLIQGNASSNVRIKLGDNAGARLFTVSDSSNAVQFSVDSDGAVTSVGAITNSGAGVFTDDITIANLAFNTRVPFLDSAGKLLSSSNLIFTTGTGTLAALKVKGVTDLRSPDIYATDTTDTVKGMRRRVMWANTTNNTQTELSFDGALGSFMDVNPGETCLFHGYVLARSTSAESNSWEIKGQVTNVSGTLNYVNTPPTTSGLFFSTGASTWFMTIDVDDTNDRVAFKVTGATSTVIDWVFTVDQIIIAN